eukprot:263948_1
MEQYNHDIRMLNYVYGICRNPTTQLLPIIITYCLAANFFVTIQRYCLENADFRHSKGFRDSTKAPATYFIGLNNFKWIDLTNLKGNNIRQHNKHWHKEIVKSTDKQFFFGFTFKYVKNG